MEEFITLMEYKQEGFIPLLNENDAEDIRVILQEPILDLDFDDLPG